MNYYLVLGVPQDADIDTIRKAFRVLARRYHPDAGKGSSVERFREVLAAYETLNDPTRRWHYDRALHERPPRPRFVEPLRAQPGPEPMLSRRREVGQMPFAHRSLEQRHLDEVIDELFRAWDEIFLGARRRDPI